jgi:hypothetical protein
LASHRRWPDVATRTGAQEPLAERFDLQTQLDEAFEEIARVLNFYRFRCGP